MFSSEVSAYSCENGWRYFPGTRSCYKLINDRNPWSVAELKCLYEGAHHTSISSYEENNFVHGQSNNLPLHALSLSFSFLLSVKNFHFSELSQYQEIWLGGAFFGQEYIYTWSDRTPYGLFEQWQAGEAFLAFLLFPSSWTFLYNTWITLLFSSKFFYDLQSFRSQSLQDTALLWTAVAAASRWTATAVGSSPAASNTQLLSARKTLIHGETMTWTTSDDSSFIFSHHLICDNQGRPLVFLVNHPIQWRQATFSFSSRSPVSLQRKLKPSSNGILYSCSSL